MIDLRSELAHLDQPGPSAAEMRARVDRRAAVVRTRRRALSAIGVALVVTGVGLATVLAGDGTSSHDSLRTRVAEQSEAEPGITTTTRVAGSGDRLDPTTERPLADTAPDTRESGAVPTTTPTPDAAPDDQAPAPGGAPSSPPAAEGCRAEGYEYGVYDGNGGFGTGGYPTCTYVATRAAGYRTHGTKWRIEIRRGGRFVDARRGGTDDPPCAPLGTIEPGDEVQVWVQAGAETAADPEWIEAGPDAHC